MTNNYINLKAGFIRLLLSILILMGLGATSSFGQVPSLYSFSSSSGTYTPITTGGGATAVPTRARAPIDAPTARDLGSHN